MDAISWRSRFVPLSRYVAYTDVWLSAGRKHLTKQKQQNRLICIYGGLLENHLYCNYIQNYNYKTEPYAKPQISFKGLMPPTCKTLPKTAKSVLWRDHWIILVVTWWLPMVTTASYTHFSIRCWNRLSGNRPQTDHRFQQFAVLQKPTQFSTCSHESGTKINLRLWPKAISERKYLLLMTL